MNAPLIVYTIGHSTRGLDEFIALLQEHGVQTLADVRTVPRSRRNPQFNQDALRESLRLVGVEYVHFPGLGGFRAARPDSPNTGWTNDSFRGFADYMLTPEFERNLDDLVDLAHRTQIAIMCAEAVYWRCHRALISDALTARGVVVEHILRPGHVESHRLTSFARVSGTQITYPSPQIED
jgi:uncharacterized protein (DUF488 family)